MITLLAVTGAPIVVVVLWWILLLLWILGNFGWQDNQNVVRGSRIVLGILLGILGFYQFGFN